MRTIAELAQVVKSNFKQLTESEIVGRVMIMTGRNLERSMKGYRMMRDEKHLEGFIEPKTDGAFEKLVAKYPNVAELINATDAIPGKIEIREPELIAIIPTDVKRLLERLDLDRTGPNSVPQDARSTPINHTRQGASRESGL